MISGTFVQFTTGRSPRGERGLKALLLTSVKSKTFNEIVVKLNQGKYKNRMVSGFQGLHSNFVFIHLILSVKTQYLGV
jgi:hypothetical protein